MDILRLIPDSPLSSGVDLVATADDAELPPDFGFFLGFRLLLRPPNFAFASLQRGFSLRAYL